MSDPIFGGEALQRVIAETVPAGQTNALVGTVDTHGAQVVARFTLGDHWDLTGAWHHDWMTHENDAAATVLLHW